MESLTTYSSKLGIYSIILTKTDTELIIEVEKITNLQLYHVKLTDDIAAEITGRMFPNIDAVFHGFVAALDNTEQNTKLTISPDVKLSFYHKTMVGKVEVPITFSITLEEIKEDPSKRQERQIASLKNKVIELETQLKSLKCLDYIHLRPEFDPEGVAKANFTFSNNYKTVLKTTSNIWSCSFAKDPFPEQGRYQFSVKLEKVLLSLHIMVGIAPGNLKSSQSCYNSNGAICFHINNSSLYYNGTNNVASAITASMGDVVTVLFDSDKGEIVFKVEGYVVFRRRCDFSSFKTHGLYPCVHLYSQNDSVSLLS